MKPAKPPVGVAPLMYCLHCAITDKQTNADENIISLAEVIIAAAYTKKSSAENLYR